MTVAELRKKLESVDPLDANKHVVVYRETDDGMALFEISDVAIGVGHARRDEDTRKAGFKFDSKGSDKRLFISIEEA